MKQYLCVLLLLCLFFTAPAQDQLPGIGEELPEIRLEKILNDTGDIRLDSGFVIIEFISTACGTCVKSIGELQELERRFGDSLQVLLVTSQGEGTVRKAILKHNWKLPVVVEDTLLKSLFPHQGVPHQVWVRNNRVADITWHHYATEDNLRKALAGEDVRTLTKKDTPIGNDELIMSPGIARPLFTSVISESIPGGKSFIRRSDSSFVMYNIGVLEMYSMAYALPRLPADAYLVLEVGDSLRRLLEGSVPGMSGDYDRDSLFLKWEEDFKFCYNLIFPSGTRLSPSLRNSVMQADFNNFFRAWLGIEAAMERREVSCLALTSDGTVPPATAGGKPDISFSDSHYRLTNMPLDMLVNDISSVNRKLGIPVVNDTGYTGNVDLEINGGLTDLVSLNKELRKYGLSLRQRKLELEVLVIREADRISSGNHLSPVRGGKAQKSN